MSHPSPRLVVVRSGEEIHRALAKFCKKWATYDGTEKSEAQTFLNMLFDAYGSDRLDVGAAFEDFKSSAGFMDLHWPGVCIVEMKAPHVSVSKAVAATADALLTLRRSISLADGIGLTELYNRVDEGAYVALVQAHRTLDGAVAACYGWPAVHAQDRFEILRRLGDLNQQIGAGAAAYAPF